MGNTAHNLFETAEFPQVDGRDYVQGVTILVRMVDAVMKAATQPSCEVARVKFLRRTLLNGTIKAAIGDTTPVDTTDAGAIVTGTVGGLPMTATFYPDEARPVTETESSPPYPFSDLVPSEPFGSTSFVSCSTGADFLWTLIEINKQTIAHWVMDRFDAPRIELVEASGFTYCDQGMMQPGKLEIGNLNVREFGSRLYILNEARYRDADGTPRTLRLQYSASPR